MAMYLFASRLSSAVCSRRPVTRTAPSRPVPSPCDDCSRLVTPPTAEPPPPPPMVTTSAVVEVTPLQRGGATRATVGPCDRHHRCDGKVPSTTKHRVRFANTFPRVNRKKRTSESHEDGETGSKEDEDDDVNTLNTRSRELVFRDGNLVSGSLEALIQRLVPTADHRPDRAFLFAFLLSSRLFLPPNQLLGQLAFLSDISKSSTEEGPIPRLVQLLAEWMETFPYDFRDDRVMAHVRAIIRKCVTGGGTEEVSAILQTLLDRLTALQRYEEFLQRLGCEQTELANKKEIMDLCSKPDELAQQLTVIELERLSYIGPEEFLQAFPRTGLGVPSVASAPRTRNLEAYVAWAHRLSYLVATEILLQTKKAKRVKMMELWISTAQSCLNHGNFNSLMSIIAGLNLSAVKRLRKTWTKTLLQKFHNVEAQMDAGGDFALYRSTLKTASRRFGSSSPSPTTDQSGTAPTTVIPFFSLFLKDVFTLQEACLKKLPNGHINFERFWQMAKLVTEFITWQQISSPQPKDSNLCLYLQSRRLYSEPELSRLSYLCESPNNIMEQEQWKTLKNQNGSKENK
ncbi:ras-GEF domain-containing family member 1B-like [Macrosteles quadrilineatus]|uniref:ras-GEF domain-containing family member 1B-like n=1 Tax=Macrosteles quadrilineatus TaxID=74068 RepID=UPI0023E1828C|nr:ras-GEF domain-containing family member 1B-like [Macrosteles quadrilineatus]